MRDKVVHSSLKPALRLDTENEIPNPSFPSSIGVIIQKGTRGYLLTFHEPKLSSLTHGIALSFEETSTVDLHNRTRDSLLSMSQACKSLAADLLQHASRLKEAAKEQQLIYDSCPGTEPESLTADSFLDPSNSGKNHAKITEVLSSVRVSSPEPDPFD
jgi:hypothetical protein